MNKINWFRAIKNGEEVDFLMSNHNNLPSEQFMDSIRSHFGEAVSDLFVIDASEIPVVDQAIARHNSVKDFQKTFAAAASIVLHAAKDLTEILAFIDQTETADVPPEMQNLFLAAKAYMELPQ